MPNKSNSGKRRGNGEGTVFSYQIKNSSKTYYCAELRRQIINKEGKLDTETFRERFDQNGDRFIRESDARKAIPILREQADAWEADNAYGSLAGKKPENYTMADLWEIYQREDLPGTSKKHREQVHRDYKRCEELYDRKWKEILVKDFQRVVDTQTSHTYDSMKKLKNLLSGLGECAIREGVCRENLARKVKLPPAPHYDKANFEWDEVEKLFEEFNREDSDLSEEERMACAGVILCACMGVRPMELENVGKPGTSIDWENRLIKGIGVKTKTGRNREVVIPEEVMDIAKRFLSPVNQFAAVTRTCWQNRLDKLLDHMDMPRRTVGAGRSTYMTRLYRNGVKERDAQKLVGHVVGSSTLATNYLKLDNESLRKEVDRVITFGKKNEEETESIDDTIKIAREKLGDEKLIKILLAQM